MVTLMRNVSNSIWHAFNSLSVDETGTVSKSKLKVLTANIGTLLELYGVEKGIEHYRSTPCLNFEHFKYYLFKEVFSSLSESWSLQVSRQYEASIDEVCWLVCKKNYLQREYPVFSDESVYQLFRIFCFLGETTEGDPPQVVMHSCEVSRVCSLFVTSLGREWEGRGFEELAAAMKSEFRFPVFLAVLEGRYAAGVEAAALKEAVKEVFDIFVEDVIKKGPLLRRGYLLPTLREFWFVLRPSELAYYKGPCDIQPSGTIPLDPNCWTEPSPRHSKDKAHRFLLVTGERSFELAAFDHKTRLQWLSALQQAISLSDCQQSYQRSQANKRRKQRELESATQNEELKRRRSQVVDMELAKAQLEAEKTARLAAEMQARELAVQARLEQSRRRELEATRRRLEELLEEETRAKRDEEIVRSLQARVLREEWERREELEKMQVEQLQLLEQETEKRKAFEKMQMERELELQEAEQRLHQLEEERRKLDKELSAARRNMLLSECSKQALEAQLRTVSPHVDKLPRRAASFMPSTKERPLHLVYNSGTLPRATKVSSLSTQGNASNNKPSDESNGEKQSN